MSNHLLHLMILSLNVFPVLRL